MTTLGIDKNKYIIINSNKASLREYFFLCNVGILVSKRCDHFYDILCNISRKKNSLYASFLHKVYIYFRVRKLDLVVTRTI